MKYNIVKTVKGHNCNHVDIGQLVAPNKFDINTAYTIAAADNTSNSYKSCGCKVEVKEVAE